MSFHGERLEEMFADLDDAGRLDLAASLAERQATLLAELESGRLEASPMTVAEVRGAVVALKALTAGRTPVEGKKPTP